MATPMKPDRRPVLCIVVLNFNAWPETVSCLKSLRKCEPIHSRVFVVDNGSTDDSVSVLRSSLEEGEVLIASRRNEGFTGGMNAGLKLCLLENAKYALLLNNDTVVERGVIEQLVHYLEASKDVGVCGPLVSLTSSPRETQFAQHRGVTEAVDDLSLSGCAFIVRLSVLNKVGLFDENFFMFGEDIDLWRRVNGAGYRVVYLPTTARVLHRKGVSSRKLGGRTAYYWSRNSFLLRRRYDASIRTFLSALSRQFITVLSARSFFVLRLKGIISGIVLWIRNPSPTWQGQENESRVYAHAKTSMTPGKQI